MEQFSVGGSFGITVPYGRVQRDCLPAAAAAEGVPGYSAFLSRRENGCQSLQMGHFPRPIGVRLIKKMWTVQTLEGPVLQFWAIEDIKGATGYTWEKVHGQGV